MKVTLTHQPETHGRGCWLVDIVSDDPDIGSVHCAHFTSPSHAGAYRKGAEAAFADQRKCPYRPDRLDSRGRISLGRRGFRNAWDQGFAAAQCYISYGTKQDSDEPADVHVRTPAGPPSESSAPSSAEALGATSPDDEDEDEDELRANDLIAQYEIQQEIEYSRRWSQD